MEKKSPTTSIEQREESMAKNVPTEIMSLTQIQKLVHLLDRSDISEIELNRANEGLRLVLRKCKVTACFTQVNEDQHGGTSKHIVPTDRPENPPAPSNLHCLRSQMIGIFHPWLKPHGKILTAVGERVKAGQIVGTIEMLAMLNEVTATVTGRVIEISIQDGQSVEYGQPLMTIDSSEEEI